MEMLKRAQSRIHRSRRGYNRSRVDTHRYCAAAAFGHNGNIPAAGLLQQIDERTLRTRRERRHRGDHKPTSFRQLTDSFLKYKADDEHRLLSLRHSH